MSLPVRRYLGVAAAAAAVLATAAVPATAASASTSRITLNRTDCNQNDYLEIHNNSGRDTLCFANAGEAGVAIYGVNWVESGNNVVKIEFQRNLNDPRLESFTLNKWSQWNPGQPSIHKITWIKIY
ncbi:beta/gamma crystallin domain-containing protein [Kitasatospora sp. NPDC056327]|uniref:beta/gamma crystallin domain-containing protein n=1 Tax=Kitasatospora sp. NPDC056327 TaxID=3345785 RepID=UPI0035E13984